MDGMMRSSTKQAPIKSPIRVFKSSLKRGFSVLDILSGDEQQDIFNEAEQDSRLDFMNNKQQKSLKEDDSNQNSNKIITSSTCSSTSPSVPAFMPFSPSLPFIPPFWSPWFKHMEMMKSMNLCTFVSVCASKTFQCHHLLYILFNTEQKFMIFKSFIRFTHIYLLMITLKLY